MLIDILDHGSKVMLLSLGMALVIATGGVDLSVGAVMAIAGSMAALLLTKSGLSVPSVILLSLAASLGAGGQCGLDGGSWRGRGFVADRGRRASVRHLANWHWHQPPRSEAGSGQCRRSRWRAGPRYRQVRAVGGSVR